MQVNDQKINRLGLGLKNDRTHLDMKEISWKGKNKVRDSLYELMDRIIMENFLKIVFKVMGNIFDKMEEDMMENENLIKYMEKEYFNGLMEGSIMENIRKILNMVLESFPGLMVVDIKDIDKVECSMAKDCMKMGQKK